MYKIYHNTKCKISRFVLQKLIETGEKVEVIDYLNKQFTIQEVENLLNVLNLQPLDIIRKKEDIFKKNYKGKSFSSDEWIRVIVKYPKLIERPIIIKGYKAIICRPLEKIYEIL